MRPEGLTLLRPLCPSPLQQTAPVQPAGAIESARRAAVGLKRSASRSWPVRSLSGDLARPLCCSEQMGGIRSGLRARCPPRAAGTPARATVLGFALPSQRQASERAGSPPLAGPALLRSPCGYYGLAAPRLSAGPGTQLLLRQPGGNQRAIAEPLVGNRCKSRVSPRLDQLLAAGQPLWKPGTMWRHQRGDTSPQPRTAGPGGRPASGGRRWNWTGLTAGAGEPALDCRPPVRAAQTWRFHSIPVLLTERVFFPTAAHERRIDPGFCWLGQAGIPLRRAVVQQAGGGGGGGGGAPSAAAAHAATGRRGLAGKPLSTEQLQHQPLMPRWRSAATRELLRLGAGQSPFLRSPVTTPSRAVRAGLSPAANERAVGRSPFPFPEDRHTPKRCEQSLGTTSSLMGCAARFPKPAPKDDPKPARPDPELT